MACDTPAKRAHHIHFLEGLERYKYTVPFAEPGSLDTSHWPRTTGEMASPSVPGLVSFFTTKPCL
jgi:hypothetical protein